jgi:hypothetical protein
MKKVILIFILFITSCNQGLTEEEAAELVPQAVTEATTPTTTPAESTAPAPTPTTTTTPGESTTTTTTSTTMTTTTPGESTTTTTVKIRLPEISISNCPTSIIEEDNYDLLWSITAGDFDVDYVRISYWINSEYFSRVYYEKSQLNESFLFPVAGEKVEYLQSLDFTDSDDYETLEVYFSISDESDSFFEIEKRCTFYFNNTPLVSTTTTTTSTTTTVPSSTTTTTSTTTTVPSSTTTTVPSSTTTTVPSSTTTTTTLASISASGSSQILECLNGSNTGEATSVHTLNNNSSINAYFDIRASVNNGASWVNVADGIEISSSNSYSFTFQAQENGVNVSWQWRGGYTNPGEGNFEVGSSVTINNCPTNPSISSISVSNITGSSVTLNWSVSGPNDNIVSNPFIWTGTDWDNRGTFSSGESKSSSHQKTINSLSGNASYNFQVCAYDGWSSGSTCSEISATTLIPIPNSQPAWTTSPFLSNSSGNQTDISWTCTDDYSNSIINKIESQKFLPGYSPTYDGQVYSGTNSNSSTITVTLTGLDPNYIYEYTVYCEDTNGYWSDRQVTLPISR